MEDPHVISLRVEHVLVVLGFCIGFGMVVCVAIVYFKVKPVRSFKMLNNNSGKKNKLFTNFIIIIDDSKTRHLHKQCLSCRVAPPFPQK